MHDELIKKNVMKADKAVIDMGASSTKVIGVHYTSKEVEIETAELIPNGASSFNFVKFANKIDTMLKSKKRRDILLSLPSYMTESKIVSVKNKTDKEAAKIIEKQCNSFGRTSTLSHVIDSVYLGKREEQGDTVSYYLITAVQKNMINELINAFEDFGLKITRVVCSHYSQICLSKVYADEFENRNRIFVDFGYKESRVMVFADNIAVYSRTINIGFSNYVEKLFDAQNTIGKRDITYALINIGMNQKNGETAKKLLSGIEDIYTECIDEVNKTFFSEFARIMDMCENNDIDITKVYFSGYVLDGFKERFSRESGVECETIGFEEDEKKARNGIILDINTNTILECRFSNVVGLAFCPLL